MVWQHGGRGAPWTLSCRPVSYPAVAFGSLRIHLVGGMVLHPLSLCLPALLSLLWYVGDNLGFSLSYLVLLNKGVSLGIHSGVSRPDGALLWYV